MHKKLSTSKVTGVWISGQNDIWVDALWLGTKNTIKGKVMASPSLGHDESCKSMYAHGSSMHQKCSNHALTNLLFSLCRFVWIIDPLVTRPSPHLRAPTRPSTPKVLWTREHNPTLYFFVISTLDSHLSFSRSVGLCHHCYKHRGQYSPTSHWIQHICNNPFMCGNKSC